MRVVPLLVPYPGLALRGVEGGLQWVRAAAALELARKSITVNSVEPGMIATPASVNLGDENHAAELTRGRFPSVGSELRGMSPTRCSYIHQMPRRT